MRAMQEASINRIGDTFKIMANHEFFHGVWSNKELATGEYTHARACVNVFVA